MTTLKSAHIRVAAIAVCVLAAGGAAVMLKGSWLAWKLPWLTQRFYHHGLHLVTVTSGLGTPWSLAFLPDGSMLVSEREGRLRHIEVGGGAGQLISGLPPVWAEGEGGLLGVAVDPQYAANGAVYWVYAEPATPERGRGGNLAVARGRLVGTELTDVRVIFRDPQANPDPRDFGGRILFGADGRLFVTVGDRAQPDEAQKLTSPRGKIIRIDTDGSAPPDNPFVGTAGANAAIWALGFRDPQGIALDPASGRLWAGDHGPAGGDELNLIVRGHNYGWPVVSYGVDEATGKQIGEGTQKPGMDQPVAWWGKVAEEGVPPTGMAFLTSNRYPRWQGQLFMATLWGQAMVRLRLHDTQVVEQQRMFTGAFERIRDVQQGPDGWLYVVANRPEGSIVRLEW